MIVQDENTTSQQGPEPGVGSVYGHGMRVVSKNLGTFLLIFVITIVFGIPSILSSILPYSTDSVFILNIVLWAYGLFVTTPLEYGISYAYLKGARGETPEIKDLTKVLENYWNILFASILCGLIVGIGFVLFIIPGIIFACKLSFVRYLVVDEKMSALAAIDESWRMTGGYSGTIFLMWLLAIPILIAGLLVFGVGAIFSMMWIEAAFASMYHAVKLEKQFYESYETKQPEQPEQNQQGPIIE